MVAEEALCGIIRDKPPHCSGYLMQILETEASNSKTTKFWVDDEHIPKNEINIV